MIIDFKLAKDNTAVRRENLPLKANQKAFSRIGEKLFESHLFSGTLE
jgi:hypothetical protein